MLQVAKLQHDFELPPPARQLQVLVCKSCVHVVKLCFALAQYAFCVLHEMVPDSSPAARKHQGPTRIKPNASARHRATRGLAHARRRPEASWHPVHPFYVEWCPAGSTPPHKQLPALGCLER